METATYLIKRNIGFFDLYKVPISHLGAFNSYFVGYILRLKALRLVPGHKEGGG